MKAKCPSQVTVRVEQHVVLPAVIVDKGFHLVDIMSLVQRDGKNLHAGFFLPVGIHLTDGVELTVAGFAPRGKEIDNKRFTAVRQGIDTHGFAIHGLQRHLWQLCKDALHSK